jgi:F-type H+-transporting ATPase subunit b
MTGPVLSRVVGRSLVVLASAVPAPVVLASHALASEAGDAHHAAPPFYLTPEFWVAVGFVIFISLIGKRAFRLIAVGLDQRAERIRTRLDEAERLAREAETLLASYKVKQAEAAAEAAAIVEDAKREVERHAAQAALELERSLQRRQQMAMDRIAQAEASAIAEVRAKAVDVAMDATRALLAERLTPRQADQLIDQAIAELPKKLH